MPHKYDYDLIVLGGGAAGLTASTGAGSFGKKVLLVEKEPKLGGDCLHYGCVPSKSLIKSARVYHTAKQMQKYGLPEMTVPEVDMAAVTKRIQAIIDEIQVHDSPEYIKDKYNVESLFGTPIFVDEHTIDVDGQKITADKFIIATGSSPAIPALKGLGEVSYLTNLTVFSLQELPESLLVLGAGPIGLEMAQSFQRLGSKVTVIQQGKQILSKEDPDVAEFFHQLFEKEGMKIHLNTESISVRQENGRIYLTVKQGGIEKVFEASHLLVATGRKPNVEGLNLKDIGIDYDRRGIKVNKRLQTTLKNIYAVGDCNGGFQFTHVAGYEGGIAMTNAIVHLPVGVDYTKVPWVTYLEPEIASVGYNEAWAKKEGLEYKVHIDYFKDNHRAVAESEKDGFIKILIGKDDKPIGVQILGENAGDLIAEWVAILNGKVSLSTVAQAIHPYPTRGEINKIASGNYVAPQFFENPVVKWLTKL